MSKKPKGLGPKVPDEVGSPSYYEDPYTGDVIVDEKKPLGPPRMKTDKRGCLYYIKDEYALEDFREMFSRWPIAEVFDA